MARKGRKAQRTGDINNIIVDLERDDEVKFMTTSRRKTGTGVDEARVLRTWKSAVSTWAIARLVALKGEYGRRYYLISMTVKAPGPHSFDGQFNVEVHGHGVDEIEELEVTG